jgi:hypothetical protein
MDPGQSEPAPTNAPVGRSVNWMDGLRFFIRCQMGFIHHSTFYFFAADHYTFFFLFF